MEVAVDIGGTFTDFVFLDRVSGSISVRKVLSTPHDSSIAVMQGLDDQDLDTVERFVHATTVVLNAVLQRKGAVTALVTTAGFRGHIEIGDTQRYTGGLFDHRWRRERPFPVPNARRLVVRERTSADGDVLCEPDEDELLALVEALKAVGAEAVAVCFLNSYANAHNEQLVSAFLADHLEDVNVLVSSELREFREYPRFITAVFNAYASTLTSAYISRLERSLADAGYRHAISYMGSGGGVQSRDAVARVPLNLLWGGIVGGVTAGGHVARLAGFADVVTFDIGGTSSDVALIKSGAAATVSERAMGAFPFAVRQVDVNSIGAGGGSIGWVDADGALKVGPHSAGADPGPACYGGGGAHCTLTDANLLLGRLETRSLLAGRMELDYDEALRAASRLAQQAGLEGSHEAARGVLEIATTHLDGAIRQVSVERGEDPSGLALVAFGGAGPMHGCEVARRLGIDTVLVPRDAGNFSAWGLLVSDERHDDVRSFIWPLMEADLDVARRLFLEMEDQARTTLQVAGFALERMSFVYTLEMRYAGQAYVEEVVLENLDMLLDRERIGMTFRHAYDRRYGYHREIEMAEISNLRLTAIGTTAKPPSRGIPDGASEPRARTSRRVFFDEWLETPVYERSALAAGTMVASPAIIEEYDSTTVVPPGWTATVDDHANLRLEHA